MRSIQWGMFALVCFVCGAQADINSWSARGPFGGIVTDVVVDPANSAVAYASARYALYKSTDSGATWAELTQDFGPYSIVDVAFDPANPARLYVASLGGGIFRSLDGGTSFTRISAVPADANVDGPCGFGISADGNTLYYPTLSGRFFRSTDGGANFSERQATPSTVQQLVVDRDISANVYAAQGSNLLKSTNGGDSWTVLPLPAQNVYATDVVLMPGTTKTLWLSTGNDVFSTQDDGQTWVPASPSLGTRILHADASSPGVLYASLRDRGGDIWRYSAGTWQALPVGLPAVVNVLAVSPLNSQTILAATASGIFRTTNGGAAWVRSDDGFNAESVRALTASAGHLYAGTDHAEIGIAADDSTLQRIDVLSGLTTTPSRTQISAIATHPADQNFVIAGFNAAGYEFSTDGGTTWAPGSASLNTAWMDAIAVDPANPLLVYAAVRPSTPTPLDPIQHSTDGGMTFSPLVTGLANIEATRLVVDPHKSSRLFLASKDLGGTNGLLRSDDSGVTWANLRDGTPIFDFAIDPADSKRLYAVTGSELLISDDGGDTFTTAAALSQAAQGNPFVLALDPVLSNVVYVLTGKTTGSATEYFVMRSVDRGVSWERIPSSSVPTWAPWKLAINSAIPTVLFAAADGRGVQSFEIAPDLAVSIVGHSGTRPLGVQSSFDVKAQNAGPLAATGVQLNIALPTGTQNVSAAIPNGTCTVGAASVQCSLPFLKLNEIASAHVNYTPAAAGSLDIRATVSARERDPVATNNTATASATATETVDLAVAGSSSAANVERGAAFVYTFQIRNAGPNASSATHLSIAAAAGVTVTSASPSGCTVSSGTINCDLGALASAATVSVTVNATATAAGTLRTTASASHAATAVDVDASNDSATVDIVSSEPPSSGGGASTPSGGGGGGGSVSMDLLVGLALLAFGSALRRYRAVRPGPQRFTTATLTSVRMLKPSPSYSDMAE